MPYSLLWLTSILGYPPGRENIGGPIAELDGEFCAMGERAARLRQDLQR